MKYFLIVRNDLLMTFRRMFSNEAFAQLDWIVIETTGLADPAPLIQSFYMDRECQQRMRLDGVLTIVDCKHLPVHLAQHRANQTSAGVHGGVSEAIKQIAYADRILLSKVDLVRESEVEALKKSIQDINRDASIMTSSFGQVDVRAVLNIRAFSPSKAANLLTKESSDDKPILIQKDASGQVLRKNIRLDLRAALAKKTNIQSTKSSNAVSTFSLLSEDPLDLDKFNEWISDILKNKGTDIYRMKGVLAMKDYDEKFVAQSIHMIFDGERSGVWSPGERRVSKLVVIGTNLDREEFEYGFAQTIAS
jgi:G3E family GTPase